MNWLLFRFCESIDRCQPEDLHISVALALPIVPILLFSSIADILGIPRAARARRRRNDSSRGGAVPREIGGPERGVTLTLTLEYLEWGWGRSAV